MGLEPRSGIKLRKDRPDFQNGLSVSGVPLTGAALANIAAVAEIDEADLAAIEDAAELAGAVGAYEGDDDIATDLAAVVTAVGDESAGLVKDVADLQETVDTASTGLVDRVGALETTVDTATTGLVDKVTALEGDVGTYSGGSDISTQLAACVARTPAAMYSLEGDDDDEYSYTETPSAESLLIPITAGSTKATIAPGGATAFALSFVLPTVKTCDMIVVAYDKGTHDAALTIGGVAVTGSGSLFFFWTGTAYATYSTNALALIIPAYTRLVNVVYADSGNALTLTMPSDGTICVITKDITGTSTVNVELGGGTTETNIDNGFYVYICIASGIWVNLASVYALMGHTHE